MRLQAALVALLVAAPLASALQKSGQDAEELRLSARSRFTVSRLFDFATYKKLFNKSYSTPSEELMRHKLFWARAFRALISSFKYKTGQSTYYLAVNLMSDETTRELRKMVDDAHGAYESRLQLEEEEEEEDEDHKEEETALSEEGDYEKNLLAYLKAHPDDPTAQELRQQILTDGLASLPVDELIDNDQKVVLNRETQDKMVEPVSESGDSEASDSLTVGQWERVEFRRVKSNRAAVEPQMKRSTGFRKQFKRLRKALTWSPRAQAVASDEVFLDLRDTNCFDLPRTQGRCGACYAFVMISILEWLHCMKTGKLVKFSEQYMIDCGRGNIDTLDGCQGGNPLAAAHFVRNFGVELRRKWPYTMRERQCPYDRDTPLETTGYFRFPVSEGLSVHLDVVPEQLKKGPLYVSIMVASDFVEFGGGVHGFGCNSIQGRHAMALVGHGRENGQEYWLLRNTYGPGWGEDGYYKLAKSANCIMPPQAYVYGTTDELDYPDTFQPNRLRDETLLNRHFDSMSLQGEESAARHEQFEMELKSDSSDNS